MSTPIKTRNAHAKELQKYLRANYDYLNSGHLYRKHSIGCAKAGKVKGMTHHTGYLFISFFGRLNFYHVAVWIWHFGERPDVVDHINRKIKDNRIENLRAASRVENSFNRSSSKNNKSGILNLSYDKDDRLWRGKIVYQGRKKSISSKNKKSVIDWISQTRFAIAKSLYEK